jgi:hypothetical protein
MTRKTPAVDPDCPYQDHGLAAAQAAGFRMSPLRPVQDRKNTVFGVGDEKPNGSSSAKAPAAMKINKVNLSSVLPASCWTTCCCPWGQTR